VFTFDLDIAPPPPRLLTWGMAVAAILTIVLLVAA
jgi:hypothetical protein